ncbi:DUF664 domain-containing protein [Pseudoclavibacter chungangensis]|uniref:DUF664 domain-containing protein n=1 Tax=Pseudoclavibacter chungangensis TaxID=587635 RepID=A0A7J5BQ32_9MICO|nr:DUF664 domain-containing protein [Pseudoclavibacter chungangensis]KAB1655642.1 DUF664 domain-containing protein [Pseudoclavibacter chungangensis]NYJ67956.1 hypothetical protein [Pseudoclavibacter chungangensis]
MIEFMQPADQWPERRPPPGDASEADLLRAFLESKRETFDLQIRYCDPRHLGQRFPRVSLSLSALAVRFTQLEHRLFCEMWAGLDPDPRLPPEPLGPHDKEWYDTFIAGRDPLVFIERWREAVDNSRALVGAMDDCGTRASEDMAPVSLRWLMLTAIDDYSSFLGFTTLSAKPIPATGRYEFVPPGVEDQQESGQRPHPQLDLDLGF